MDVVLDSNVLIADPWLRSHRIRSLLDYLTKTDSQLWLLEPVEIELRSHLARTLQAQARNVSTAIASAQRFGMHSVPQFSADVAVSKALAEWEAEFIATTAGVAVRLPHVPEVLTEAFRRGAERVPPCSPAGGEIRDAIIWLTALYHAKKGHTRLAFISTNTRDFAAADHCSLRDELRGDVLSQGIDLVYFASLDQFLAIHAKPVAHISRTWIDQRLNAKDVERLLRHEMNLRGDRYLRPRGLERGQAYVSKGDPKFTEMDLSLDTYLVWPFDDGRIDVDLSYGAFLVAEVDFEPREIDWNDRSKNETVSTTCIAQIGFHLIARAEGDALTPDRIEDIYDL